MAQQLLTESPEKTTQRIARREVTAEAARFSHGGSLSPLLQLQRTLGNQRVAQLIHAKRLSPQGRILDLQRKLTVGAADDQYEQEADRVARHVVSMPDSVALAALQPAPPTKENAGHPHSLQSKPLPLVASITPFAQRTKHNGADKEEDQGQDKPEEVVQAKHVSDPVFSPLQRQEASEKKDDEQVQAKRLAGTSPETLQRQSAAQEEDRDSIQAKSAASLASSFDAGTEVESRLSQSKGVGSPLPDPVRAFMEPRFGVDFSHVRVHTGSHAVQMNRAVAAQAFTHGTDIYYGVGSSPTNLDLTAHELTHVVQQTGGKPLQTKKQAQPIALVPEPPVQRTCAACAAGVAPCFTCADDKTAVVQRQVSKSTDPMSPILTSGSPAAIGRMTGGLLSQDQMMSLRRQLVDGATSMQRELSLSDIIPDAILNPIKSLASQVTSFGPDVTTKSDTAASNTQSEADAEAAKVDDETGAKVTAEQANGEVATTRAQTQGASAEMTANSTRASGGMQAAQINNALPTAEYVSDPVKPAVQAPPAGKLPGEGQVAAKGATETWNCDEASILNKVSSVGKGVIQSMTKVVKAIVPESVLQFAQQGIAKLKTTMGAIKQKVEAAKQAVTRWVDNKLKPVRDTIRNAEQFVSEKIRAAKQAISEKISQATAWAATKWTALKTKVTATINSAIKWAKTGIGSLVDKAKSLAGRFWDMLPDWIKGPLAGTAAALAAPIALAYKAIETSAAWVEKKATWVKERLVSAADKATKWLGDKYQKVRTVVVKAGESISKGIDWVKKKGSDVGRAVYNGIDKLSGGRISKWRAAAAQRLAELKGDVCAATGAMAGPCVERFLPEPAGPEGKSFASLTTKADVTVPIEGVPVKVSAGATITIERTAKKYNVILSGEGFAGIAINLTGGSSGGGGSGSVTVDGTLPNKALALLSLNGQNPGLPGVLIPVGGGQTPANSAAKAPSAVSQGGAGAGGGAASASAEVGKKVSVALTYVFDATTDKSSCDGLGGLTAFLASQGAAALLPAPFSHLAAAGGQAAFANKLRSTKVTVADTGSVSAQVGKGAATASGSVNVERGISVESAIGDDNSRSLSATLFQALSGELAVNFAPEGIGLGKLSGGLGGRQELAITYNITQDKLDAGFKQALSGSVTLSTFAGMVGSLPTPVREQVRRMLACLPGANDASVSFELSNNVVNLSALAQALDGELNKGKSASASGVWDAVSGFLRNKENCYIEFSAKLTLIEKMLGVKASGSVDQASGGAELTINRGQEIVICPPTRLLQDGGGGTVPAAAAAPSVAPSVPIAKPQPLPRTTALPFFHGSTWRLAQSIPGHVKPVGGGDFGQGFYTHHDTNSTVAAERARWEGCRLCQKLGPQERYAGVIRFDVTPSEYQRITNRLNLNLTTTTQPDYAARQKEWLDFVSGPGRGREACPVFDPAHMSWRHQRVDPPPDQGLSLIEGPMYKGVEGLPGGSVPPRSAFDPYAEGTSLPQQVVWNHDQAMAVLNATPTSLKQFDAANGCAPVDPPASIPTAATIPVADEARAREAAQAEMTGR